MGQIETLKSTHDQLAYELPVYDKTLELEMAPLYDKVKTVITPMEWAAMAPKIKVINELKKKRNAVILAHNYMTPEIFHCISDFRGDSLQLAKEAANVSQDVIVQCGVHFMAETSKIMSPEKTVLIPDQNAGCSLAEAITPADVRALREAYPGVPIVSYVNTTADVKAEVDICCTSSNAVDVVNSLGVPRVIMLPDEYLAKYVATKTDVEIIAWKGHCEVHERFTAQELETMREAHPGLVIVAHPECPPDVIKTSDFTGSTSGMIKWVKDHRPSKVMLVTECSMSDNVAAETPDVEFIRPCNFCPHMKLITLDAVLKSLATMSEEVVLDPDLCKRARGSVDRMIAVNLSKAA